MFVLFTLLDSGKKDGLYSFFRLSISIHSSPTSCSQVSYSLEQRQWLSPRNPPQSSSSCPSHISSTYLFINNLLNIQSLVRGRSVLELPTLQDSRLDVLDFFLPRHRLCLFRGFDRRGGRPSLRSACCPRLRQCLPACLSRLLGGLATQPLH